MASQNLNVGTSANAGDGMSLRQAFVNTRKMFADMYGITYTSDTQDISGSNFAIDHACFQQKLYWKYNQLKYGICWQICFNSL